ncbi:cyclase family protein [Leucobacter allii]|uniref:Cyclase family protein n=1 Tax=Leucobacter allii TaxID=2932247 RepID=A0ABY4FMJ8_9MICO|nr:cyclase family protein [Leucobacter allii]UOQ57498.1 cyclase family protein [Leucobacter allii]
MRADAETDGYRALGRKLSNWGRWGPDDELGTINLITPERRAAAAALVSSGLSFGLGLPLGADGPQTGESGRQNPLHLMTRTVDDPPHPTGFHYFDDALFVHLQASTQLDGLAHVGYDGQLYNGVPVTAVTRAGAARLGVQHLATALTGRGVLLDIPRLLGRRLGRSEEISAALLERAAREQRVAIGAGDLLFIRTGWIARITEEHDRRGFFATEPGLALDTASWLADRDVAFVASDNWGVEATPARGGDEMPLHCVLIRDVGMPLGEMLDLEAVAAHAASIGRWEFFASCAALEVVGGVGSVLTPIVTF